MLNFNIYAAVFFESLAVFMTIFFFIQYSILKRKEHLYYALYLLAVFIYYLLAVPDLFFGSDYAREYKNTFFELFKRPVQFFTSVFYTFFVIHYLGLKLNSGYLYRFFRFLIVMYVILSFACLVLNFFQIPYNSWYYIFSLLIFPVQLYVVIALFKNKVAYSRYIIWGTIIILIGSSLSLMISIYSVNHGLNTLSQNVRIFLPAQLSILVDMFLFSIALQKKIADNEKSLINAAYQRQQAVLLERERIIADLHDDVGGGLSSIRMMSDLLAQGSDPLKQGGTASFAQKISLTAKDIAQRMNTIIWSLNAENDTLENFVEYVRQYGVSFFENSGIYFHYSADENLPAGKILKGVQRKNLFLIMKEAFHNILKHADASKANVSISIKGKRLSIEITDNGKGITDPNQFGNGLKNMKKRMDEIGGSIDITSNHGTFIKIEVEIG